MCTTPSAIFFRPRLLRAAAFSAAFWSAGLSAFSCFSSSASSAFAIGYSPGRVLALRWRRFLARDGLSWPLARARVGMRALTPHRQILAMSQAAIGSHVKMTLDVGAYFTPEIPFDFLLLIDDLADLDHVIIGQIVAFQIQRNSRLSEYFSRCATPDAVNVS